jgi:hypothetical protein
LLSQRFEKIERMKEAAGPGDGFRALADVLRADPRQEGFGVFDEDGTFRRKSLEDLHAAVASLELEAEVPLDVRIQFDNARNLLLHSWFVYRFVQVAELQALRTLEFSLTQALKVSSGRRIMLASLLERARKAQRIDGAAIASALERLQSESGRGLPRRASVEQPDPDWALYVEELSRGIASYRNTLAHGGQLLAPGGFTVLEVCRVLINQLFVE